ncbi:MAG: DUF126 domain-containing protein [Nitrosopumilaceae archaeon]|nr:DUF126 domain-containing protein [Nitrosopumilaceae archaeon]
MKTQQTVKKFIIKGMINGIVLKSDMPINFLSLIDVKTGIIKDPSSNLFQKSIKNVILVFPHAIGSSVGAYSIYSLKSNNKLPSAMLCKNADLIVSSGCALANIPLATIYDNKYEELQTGDEIMIS